MTVSLLVGNGRKRLETVIRRAPFPNRAAQAHRPRRGRARWETVRVTQRRAGLKLRLRAGKRLIDGREMRGEGAPPLTGSSCRSSEADLPAAHRESSALRSRPSAAPESSIKSPESRRAAVTQADHQKPALKRVRSAVSVLRRQVSGLVGFAAVSPSVQCISNRRSSGQ
jgi:hypothetical protein